MSDLDTLKAQEQRLQEAQLRSDVAELNCLLHPDLIFVGPDGTLGDKESDLSAHRIGLIRLNVLEPDDLVVRIFDGVGITVLTAQLEGVFANEPFSTRMIYTRTWTNGSSGWRVIAAHISAAAPSPK